MKLRYKLLILILVVGLLPMAFTRGYIQGHVTEMSREMAEQIREVLLERAEAELLLRVEAHADSLKMAEGILGLVLQLQVSQLENLFEAELLRGNKVDSAHPEPMVPNWSESNLCRTRGSGECIPVKTAFNFVEVREGPGASPDQTRLLRSMLPVYKSLHEDFPELISWQMTAFNSGTVAVYPGVDHVPMMFRPVREEWFKKAVESEGPVWSLPAPDPVSRKMVMINSRSFKDANGEVAGATCVMIPVNSLLDGGSLTDISTHLTALLVQLESSYGQKGDIVVIARESSETAGMGSHHWRRAPEPERLNVEDAAGAAAMIEDLKAGRSGTRRMKYEGKESFWAYAPLADSLTCALLIVPTEDVSGPADDAERYILDKIYSQVRRSMTFIGLTLLATLVAGVFVVRAVTRNIGTLVACVRRLAAGDFTARADMSSRDEVGELARAFNRMVPALQDRLKMRQSLDVAKEVQNNLLPREDPEVAGMDVAGISRYCEATGGDYYDYFGKSQFGQGRVGIVVGDVTGHGVPAALMMASGRAYLRLRTGMDGDLAKAMADVNERLYVDSGMSGRFMTLFCGIVEGLGDGQNRQGGRLKWVRAGHDPAIVYDPAQDEFQELMGNGLPLGTVAADTYSENEVDLPPNSVLAVGTDGIWETVNEAGEMFGRERFKEIIRSNAGLSSREILSAVIREVDEFKGDLKQRDDVTLVVVKVAPSASA